MKKILILCALVLGACYVETHRPHPNYYEVYECDTYMYCDGIEYYEQFSTCTTGLGALSLEDDLYYSCETDGYYSCYYYECAANCYPTGYVCKA